MKITVVEKSGKKYEFTTESFCTQEPFKGKGTSKNKDDRNVLTEFCLLVDEFIKTKELRLLVAWHNINNDERTTYEDEDEGTLKEVYRETSIEIPLAVPEQYNRIVQILVDDEILFIRMGDDLINYQAFKNQEILCHSTNEIESLSKKVVALYKYLYAAWYEKLDEETKKIEDNKTEEEKKNNPIESILIELGFTKEAYQIAEAQENNNEDSSQDSTDEDFSSDFADMQPEPNDKDIK